MSTTDPNAPPAEGEAPPPATTKPIERPPHAWGSFPGAGQGAGNFPVYGWPGFPQPWPPLPPPPMPWPWPPMPWPPVFPGNALPGYPVFPGNALPGYPTFPGNALPGAPVYPGHGLPTPPAGPDAGLPSFPPVRLGQGMNATIEFVSGGIIVITLQP